MSVNFFTVFDADYYRAINPDLAGFNDTEARRHFFNNGLAESRQFSPFIDLNWYRSHNPDLRNLNNSQLFFHLLNSGINEGLTFSPYVDIQFYKQVNSDLSGFSNEGAFEHLLNSGINEGRQFSGNVDIVYYKAENPDLANLSNQQAFEHLINFGIREGRRFFPPANSIDMPDLSNGSSLQAAIEEFARTDPGGPYIILQASENQGNELLIGSAAAEIISGGGSRDIFIGGPGNDVFFLSPDRAVNDPENADIIVDYNRSGDRIAITGGLAVADLSFAAVEVNFEDLQQLRDLNNLLEQLDIEEFGDLQRVINNLDEQFLGRLLSLIDIQEPSLDLLLASGIIIDSVDPDGDEVIQGLAINSGDRTLGIVFNATVADVRNDLIFL